MSIEHIRWKIRRLEPTLLYTWQVKRASAAPSGRLPSDEFEEYKYLSKKSELSRQKEAYADLEECNAERLS